MVEVEKDAVPELVSIRRISSEEHEVFIGVSVLYEEEQ